MFIFFLSTLDYLGMLFGGIAFVFGLLTFLGGFSPNLIFKHLTISILSIGFMWMIFTFGLRVMLPEGEILRVW
jgi:predicted membrane-bound spermidine synthase